jgi:hypothetical protein
MTTEHKLIKSKMGLLDMASYLHNVSEACRVMGYSRDTFYRVKKAYEEGGIEALTEKTRRKPCIKNRVPEEVEKAVLELALDDPSLARNGSATPCALTACSSRQAGCAASGCVTAW